MMHTIVLLSFLITGTLQAQSPFDFIQLGVSARSAGLGGAFTSMTNDQTSIFFNPGTLSSVENSKVSATFMKHVLDIS